MKRQSKYYSHYFLSGTVQTQQLGSQFFAKRPTDNTFINVSEVCYEPQTTLSGAHRKFCFRTFLSTKNRIGRGFSFTHVYSLHS